MASKSNLYFFLVALIVLIVELVYFRLAIRYSIMDKPNDRSSHVNHAIRGGGVIFMVSVLLWFFTHELAWPWFVMGAFFIAVVSFLDDVISLNPLARFLVQLLSVLLLFTQIGLFSWPVYLLVLAVVICVGALNAFNFMDGINGITGVYSVVSLISFGYIQRSVISFTDPSLISVVLIAVFIFLFFNFRTNARCFAGDVGSVTIAFVLIFLLLQLIITTDNFLWVFMFLVYGVDSVVTILYRLKRKENIFKAHRTHLYQYLANESGWQHQKVSLLYAAIQGVLNTILIYSFWVSSVLIPIASAIIFLIAYLWARIKIQQRFSTSASN